MPKSNWISPYPISDAENGKFVTVDMSDVTGYAQLSANSAYRGIRYAILVQSVDNGADALYGANTIWVASSSIAASSVYKPIPPETLSELQIQNKSGGSIYFIPSSTNTTGASALGIEIANNTLYIIQKHISEFSISSVSGGDVRVIGYYMV